MKNVHYEYIVAVTYEKILKRNAIVYRINLNIYNGSTMCRSKANI